MIILSGVLVVLAIALLVTGIVTGNTGHEILGLDGLKLIYVSIGVSIVSALFLAVGVFLRRKELFGTVPSPAAKAAGGRTSTRPVKAKARVGAGDDAPAVPATSATATDVPAETTVYVVPGRKRYHLETCRQLAGRDKEELTFVEAREEGFTPCTACLPDTALAARAAFTDTGQATGSATGRPGDSADSPVEVTRTDIPAARPPAEPRPSADTRDDLRDTGRTRELPAESAAPTAGAASGRVTPGSTEPEASEQTVAAERPAEPPARRRSMFEPLDRSDTEAATGRTTPGGRDDEDETTAERAGASPRPETEPETGRDEAGVAAGESSRRPGAGDDADAGQADDAADEAATGPRTTVTAADDAEGARTSAGATGTKGAGEETHAGEPEAADAAETVTAPATTEREEPRDDAAGDTADGDTAGTAGTATSSGGAAEADGAEAGDMDETDAGTLAAGDRAEPADDATTDDPTTDDATTDAASAGDAGAAAEPESGHEAADTDDADERPAGDGDAESGTGGPVVRVLSGTKRYHRPDCALIEGIADDADDLESLPRAEAKDRGCTPCLVCQPDDD